MGKLRTAIICVVALAAIAWGIVAAYQHQKRMSWRPPRAHLNPQLEALRNQFHAAIAEGTGISNNIPYPKEDHYLDYGATPAELKKGKRVGDAIVSGDYTAFAKLADLWKEEAAAFKKERAGWSHEQYNELAGDAQFRIYAPSAYAGEIWLAACLDGNKKALEGMDYAFQVPEMKHRPVELLSALAWKGNEKAFEVFLSPTNFGLTADANVKLLNRFAAKGNERAVDALIGIIQNKKYQVSWFMAMEGLHSAITNGYQKPIDALADIAASNRQDYFKRMISEELELAAASGNNVAINALTILATNKDNGVREPAIEGLREAAAGHNTNAIEALRRLDAP